MVDAGNSLRVAIPKAILKAVGVRKGDTLLMTTTEHQIPIREQESSRRKKA